MESRKKLSIVLEKFAPAEQTLQAFLQSPKKEYNPTKLSEDKGIDRSSEELKRSQISELSNAVSQGSRLAMAQLGAIHLSLSKNLEEEEKKEAHKKLAYQYFNAALHQDPFEGDLKLGKLAHMIAKLVSDDREKQLVYVNLSAKHTAEELLSIKYAKEKLIKKLATQSEQEKELTRRNEQAARSSGELQKNLDTFLNEQIRIKAAAQQQLQSLLVKKDGKYRAFRFGEMGRDELDLFKKEVVDYEVYSSDNSNHSLESEFAEIMTPWDVANSRSRLALAQLGAKYLLEIKFQIQSKDITEDLAYDCFDIALQQRDGFEENDSLGFLANKIAAVVSNKDQQLKYHYLAIRHGNPDSIKHFSYTFKQALLEERKFVIKKDPVELQLVYEKLYEKGNNPSPKNQKNLKRASGKLEKLKEELAEQIVASLREGIDEPDPFSKDKIKEAIKAAKEIGDYHENYFSDIEERVNSKIAQVNYIFTTLSDIINRKMDSLVQQVAHVPSFAGDIRPDIREALSSNIEAPLPAKDLSKPESVKQALCRLIKENPEYRSMALQYQALARVKESYFDANEEKNKEMKDEEKSIYHLRKLLKTADAIEREDKILSEKVGNPVQWKEVLKTFGAALATLGIAIPFMIYSAHKYGTHTIWNKEALEAAQARKELRSLTKLHMDAKKRLPGESRAKKH